MAVGGRGIALLPMFFVQPQLDAGELVRVLPRLIDAKSQIAVVYAERELMPPQLRAFIDVAVRWNPEIAAERAACGEGAKALFGTSRAT